MMKAAQIARGTQAPLELTTPLTGKARHMAMMEEARLRATTTTDAANMDKGEAKSTGKAKATTSGKPGLLSRAWAAITSHPDHSYEGLMKATKDAIAHSMTIKYVNAKFMCEDIEAEIATALKADGGVIVKFIGVHEDDGSPRIIVSTVWGWRIAVRGTLKFGAWPTPSTN